MKVVDLLQQTAEIEFPMTRRILESVPADRADFAPHPKSMPLGKLAMHVATLPGLGTLILTTDSVDAATTKWPPLVLRSHEDLLSTFDEGAARMQQALSDTTDEALGEPWRFGVGEQVFSNHPRAVSLNHMLFGHLSHHRAQLGTYLRALDLPVPGVYGPSADDQLK